MPVLNDDAFHNRNVKEQKSYVDTQFRSFRIQWVKSYAFFSTFRWQNDWSRAMYNYCVPRGGSSISTWECRVWSPRLAVEWFYGLHSGLPRSWWGYKHGCWGDKLIGSWGCGDNLTCITFEWVIRIDICSLQMKLFSGECHKPPLWLVNIGPGNDLVPSLP